MKKNISGFMLVETLIVSVFVLTTLIYLFVQFQRIGASYDATFTYNTTSSLYRTNNIKKYILNNGFTTISTALDNGSDEYIDITSCPSTYFTNTTFCVELFTSLGVEKALFTNEDLTNLLPNINNLYFIGDKMKNFIRYINFEGNASEYRIIVEFDNGEFGSLRIY